MAFVAGITSFIGLCLCLPALGIGSCGKPDASWGWVDDNMVRYTCDEGEYNDLATLLFASRDKAIAEVLQVCLLYTSPSPRD